MIDSKVMVGKPLIKGTRITVEAILKLLSAGASTEEILEDYPQLEKDDIKAALDYSARVIANEEVYPLTGGKRAKVPGG